MNSLISIIIPIYNSEKYLNRCIDSILCQYYQNFELILIDDGSSDGSLEICKSYKEIDSRIIITSQSNRGPSCARNIGIALAKGVWITFVDSDDYVSPEYLSSFVDNIKPGCFFYCQGMVVENGNGIIGYRKSEEVIGCNGAKLFYVPIFKEHQIKYNEKLCHGEDLLLIIQYLRYSECIGSLSDIHYHYFRRKESLSHTDNLDVSIKNLLLFNKLMHQTSCEQMKIYIKNTITIDLLHILLSWVDVADRYQRKKFFNDLFSREEMYHYFPKQFKIDKVVVYLIKKHYCNIANFVYYYHRRYIIRGDFRKCFMEFLGHSI